MREYPTLNYPIEIRGGAGEFLNRFGTLVPGAFRVIVNHVVHLAILPELPRSPWPPPFPENWDDAESRETALAFAFATTNVLPRANPVDRVATDRIAAWVAAVDAASWTHGVRPPTDRVATDRIAREG